MKSILALFPIAVAAATASLEQPATAPVLGTDTVHGCYSSVGELVLNSTNTFNAQGLCGSNCRALGAAVAAMQGSKCYCGDKYPAASALVADSQCSEACPGFAASACGGSTAYTVLNTGVKVDVENSTGSASSSQVSSLSVASAATVVPSMTTSLTALVTAAGTPTPVATTKSSSNGTTTAGTATSSTAVPVSSSGAMPQLSLNSLNLAVLGLGTVFLL